jgi:preprotein translocase subunit SecF
MEPNKMEKDFKEKLEQRTIQPSDMAWDRLDAMLSVAENKKPKKDRTWMYMAAAFLVFLLVGVLFLNQEKEGNDIQDTNSIVTTQGESENTTENEDGETVIAPVSTQETAVAQSLGNSSKTNSNSKNGIQQETLVSATDEGIVIQIAPEGPANTIVQVNNAEELLAAATPSETAKKKRVVKVDPNSLLSSVEEELDDSFKDKVLIATVKNIKALQSTVANRNYQ